MVQPSPQRVPQEVFPPRHPLPRARRRCLRERGRAQPAAAHLLRSRAQPRSTGWMRVTTARSHAQSGTRCRLLLVPAVGLHTAAAAPAVAAADVSAAALATAAAAVAVGAARRPLWRKPSVGGEEPLEALTWGATLAVAVVAAEVAVALGARAAGFQGRDPVHTSTRTLMPTSPMTSSRCSWTKMLLEAAGLASRTCPRRTDGR
mmetsp:Transcript_43638/g.124821  ORF Transcript_43638/g.124821 Transcript_43638/m.124821 type:complete len:204 (-) Transcript_43638:411-1022(-)